MSSERRKGYRKLSRGILKSRTRDGEDQRHCHGVKIYINSNDNEDPVSSGADQEEFEKLKDIYYKQCQPINVNLIRRLSNKHPHGFPIDGNECTRISPPQAASTMIFENKTHKPSRSAHHDNRHKPAPSRFLPYNPTTKNHPEKKVPKKKKERTGCLDCRCRHL